MTHCRAVIASGLAGIFLTFGVATTGNAADDEVVDEPAPAEQSLEAVESLPEEKASAPKTKKKASRKASKAGIKIKVDDIRVEFGPFIDGAAPSTDAFAHGAVSAKGQSGAWEFALGARFDAYSQSGSQDFYKDKLDYTENYLRWRGEDTRITVGTQNVLWGRTDEISPIDRMSRADLSRIVLDKLPERRRAVPAVRLEQFAGDFKIDAVWLPVFDAAVLPDRESFWSPVDTVNGRLLGVGDMPFIIGARVREDEHGSGGGGVRITRSGGGVDYGFTLQRVRQSQPYYRAVAPGLLEAIHPYSWVVGGELEAQKWGATWRMEAAWSSDQPVTTRTFQYRTEPAFDLVVGTEFFPGDGDTRVTLQVTGHKTFTDTPLLERDNIYNLTGEIEHPFAQGRWRANLRFIAGINDQDFYITPKIAYIGIDQHEFFLAAHVFSGSEKTLGGYYEDGDLILLGWQAKF